MEQANFNKFLKAAAFKDDEEIEDDEDVEEMEEVDAEAMDIDEVNEEDEVDEEDVDELREDEEEADWDAGSEDGLREDLLEVGDEAMCEYEATDFPASLHDISLWDDGEVFSYTLFYAAFNEVEYDVHPGRVRPL